MRMRILATEQSREERHGKNDAVILIVASSTAFIFSSSSCEGHRRSLGWFLTSRSRAGRQWHKRQEMVQKLAL